MVNTYESIFICPGDLSQDKVEAALEKVKGVVTRSEGKIVTAELWGRRRLAYPIDHQREGHYGYLIFSANAEAPANLDRHYRVTDAILRGLTVKVDPRHLEKIRPAARAVSAEGGTAPAESPAKPETQPAPPAAAAGAAPAAPERPA